MDTAPEHVHDLVDAYLHEILSPPDRQRIQRHCATCPACQAALAGARLRLEALRTLPPVEATEQLIQRTEQRLGLAPAPTPGRGPIDWLRSRSAWWGAGLAALAAGLLIGAL